MIYAKEIKLTRRVSFISGDPQHPDHMEVYWDSTATIAGGTIETPIPRLPPELHAAYKQFEATLDAWLAERIKE